MIKSCHFFSKKILFTALFLGLIFTHNQAYSAELTKVRSAFIFKLSKFLTFPAPNLNEMNFCFFDDKQGPGNFLRSKKGLISQNKPISIIFFDGIDKITELNQKCNIIYLSENIQSKIDKHWINKINPKVVVIGETLEFLDLGGLVALIQERSKVRIFVNKAKLSQSQVKIESRLLALVKFHPQ